MMTSDKEKELEEKYFPKGKRTVSIKKSLGEEERDAALMDAYLGKKVNRPLSPRIRSPRRRDEICRILTERAFQLNLKSLEASSDLMGGRESITGEGIPPTIIFLPDPHP